MCERERERRGWGAKGSFLHLLFFTDEEEEEEEEEEEGERKDWVMEVSDGERSSRRPATVSPMSVQNLDFP